jgi:hypothetical protein
LDQEKSGNPEADRAMNARQISLKLFFSAYSRLSQKLKKIGINFVRRKKNQKNRNSESEFTFFYVTSDVETLKASEICLNKL